MAEWFAEKGWEFAQKQDQVSKPSSFCLSGENTHRIHKHSRPPVGKRHHSTAAAWKRDYSTPAHRLPDSQSVALMTGDVQNFPTNLKQLYEKLVNFMEEEIYPIEEAFFEHQRSDGRWIPHFEIERIKVTLFQFSSNVTYIANFLVYHRPKLRIRDCGISSYPWNRIPTVTMGQDLPTLNTPT